MPNYTIHFLQIKSFNILFQPSFFILRKVGIYNKTTTLKKRYCSILYRFRMYKNILSKYIKRCFKDVNLVYPTITDRIPVLSLLKVHLTNRDQKVRPAMGPVVKVEFRGAGTRIVPDLAYCETVPVPATAMYMYIRTEKFLITKLNWAVGYKNIRNMS